MYNVSKALLDAPSQERRGTRVGMTISKEKNKTNVRRDGREACLQLGFRWITSAQG